jgi:hypothetical protein
MKKIIKVVIGLKDLFLMFFTFHFIACFRVIMATIGWRRTYLIHCNAMVLGGKMVSLSFAYTCKPWFTVYHFPEVEELAAKHAGMQGPNTRVTVISISRIGNP